MPMFPINTQDLRVPLGWNFPKLGFMKFTLIHET